MFTVLLLNVGRWVWCWGVLCWRSVHTEFRESWSFVSNVKWRTPVCTCKQARARTHTHAQHSYFKSLLFSFLGRVGKIGMLMNFCWHLSG